MEPGAESRAAIELTQLLEGAQKALLNNVFGIVLISGHSVGQPEYRFVVALCQYTEILHSLSD